MINFDEDQSRSISISTKINFGEDLKYNQKGP